MLPLEQVFDSLTTAVLILDREARCEYANESCQTLLLKSMSALENRSIEQILESNEEVARLSRRAADQGQRVILREVDIYLPEWKQHLLLDLTITPGMLGGELRLVIEMNDRKEVQKLLHDTDMKARFKVATQIVRGLAHEIKNPLGGIRGAAQLLALETDNEDTREYTSVITQEVDRLSELLTRMSGGNKSLDYTHVDIHEPITHIANLLKAEHGEILEIGYNFDTSLPRIEVNLDQVKQALLNLMKNAVQWSLVPCDSKPSHSCARVCIRTRVAHPDPRRSLMPEQGVRIQVQDSGPGVDSSIVDQLFLPLVSRREGGTGLGLSISQEIAQNHGGFIELDQASAERGASFSIYLPYTQSKQGTTIR